MAIGVKATFNARIKGKHDKTVQNGLSCNLS